MRRDVQLQQQHRPFESVKWWFRARHVNGQVWDQFTLLVGTVLTRTRGIVLYSFSDSANAQLSVRMTVDMTRRFDFADALWTTFPPRRIETARSHNIWKSIVSYVWNASVSHHKICAVILVCIYILISQIPASNYTVYTYVYIYRCQIRFSYLHF